MENCTKCGKDGHLEANCPDNVGAGSSGTPPTSAAAGTTGGTGTDEFDLGDPAGAAAGGGIGDPPDEPFTPIGGNKGKWALAAAAALLLIGGGVYFATSGDSDGKAKVAKAGEGVKAPDAPKPAEGGGQVAEGGGAIPAPAKPKPAEVPTTVTAECRISEAEEGDDAFSFRCKGNYTVKPSLAWQGEGDSAKLLLIVELTDTDGHVYKTSPSEVTVGSTTDWAPTQFALASR